MSKNLVKILLVCAMFFTSSISIPKVFSNGALQPVLSIKILEFNDVQISSIKIEVEGINNASIWKLDENRFRLQAWKWYKVFVSYNSNGVQNTMRQEIYADRQWITITFNVGALETSNSPPRWLIIFSLINFAFIFMTLLIGGILYFAKSRRGGGK